MGSKVTTLLKRRSSARAQGRFVDAPRVYRRMLRNLRARLGPQHAELVFTLVISRYAFRERPGRLG